MSRRRILITFIIRMKKLLLAFILLISLKPAVAQFTTDRELIQFSGVVVDDSLRPIPFTSVMIKNQLRGTVADYYGFFSFVAKEKDTIEFSSIGFKKAYFVIPDSLTTNKYSLIQVLRRDTVYLKETVIYPWPTKEQFKDAFLRLEVPDDDLARAHRNLDQQVMTERYAGMGNDASMAYKSSTHSQNSRLYYAGQYPPNNLLNPIAWSKFLKAWKKGDLKRK